MKLQRAALQTRFGRRLLLLFFLCAFLPAGALAVLSFVQVRRQLLDQSRVGLTNSSRAEALMALERLTSLDMGMDEIVRAISFASGGPSLPPDLHDVLIGDRFTALLVESPEGSIQAIHGDPMTIPELIGPQRDALDAGASALLTLMTPGEDRVFAMGRVFSVPGDPGRWRIFGILDSDYLWRASENLRSQGVWMMILDQDGVVRFRWRTPGNVLDSLASRRILSGWTGDLDLEHEGGEEVAVFRGIATATQFGHPDLHVVLGESFDSVMRPVAQFNYYFLLVVLVTFWVVLLLGIGQIRRNLGPLQMLQEGTLRLSQGGFDDRVHVTSGDEFEDLAASFNEMASQIGRQFRTLQTFSELDRAVLSSLDEDEIIKVLLTQGREVMGSDALCLALFDRERGEGICHLDAGWLEEPVVRSMPALNDPLWERMSAIGRYSVVDGDADGLPLLESFKGRGLSRFALLPIRIKERLSGLLIAGFEKDDPREEALHQARQLADQLAVALDNARLVVELDELSWGAMSALARAIDAKSHWTGGHSERVTELALQTARRMQFSRKDLDTLHRGGLLHDVGKIGVPAEILDKPGKLTPEEMKAMQSHTVLGARILEPLTAFKEAVPIVLHHHEQYDGSGYPHGLAREEIDPLARVLSVADFYDALTSDRPYRAAWKSEDVLTLIEEESGRQFDPLVVDAFLSMMGERQRSVQKEA